MAQHYSTPKRARDPHALPDVETFYIGTVRNWRDPLPCFLCAENETPHGKHVGWYWQACFPGCLGDGEPVGPFATVAEALADAREGFDDFAEEEGD